MPLFFIFIMVPLVELMLLLEVGAIIGSGWTFIIIILTAILGTKLVKQQGVQTWSKIQSELATGALPARAMFDGICILVSGVLLITPGFMTDILGLLLLTPPFRAVAYKQVGNRIQVRGSFSRGHTYQHSDFESSPFDQNDDGPTRQNQDPKTIEGEFERKD